MRLTKEEDNTNQTEVRDIPIRHHFRASAAEINHILLIGTLVGKTEHVRLMSNVIS